MEGIGLPGSQFPPGFRFHPTDQELIIHYLRKKATSSQSTPLVSIIADINLYKFDPWELPDKALFGEGEWFFFSPRDRKYPNGARPNRAAASGYWKATGTDIPILVSRGSQCLGVKKALVFYKGRPPKGIKTDWIMNEYRLLDDQRPQKHKGSMRLDDWVLCRVRHKGAKMLVQTEEQHGSSDLSQLLSNLYLERHRERSNMFEGSSDYQLLAHFLGSQEGGEIAGENSDLGSIRYSDVDMVSQESVEAQPPLGSPVQPMLDSIERTFSFGELDELMML